MKVFFDTEFTGLHQHTTLISLGMVAEDGREFYAELTDYNETQVDPWIKENVLAHLMLNQWPKGTVRWGDGCRVRYRGPAFTLGEYAKTWLNQVSGGKLVEMWGDCMAYDWVLFCQLYGGAMKIPEFISIYCRDLATMFEQCGLDPDLGRMTYSGVRGVAQHNALEDAHVIRHCYYRAMGQEPPWNPSLRQP